MALIDAEQDDKALLEAEDAAIRAIEQPVPEPPPDDIAELIGRLTDAQVRDA